MVIFSTIYYNVHRELLQDPFTYSTALFQFSHSDCILIPKHFYRNHAVAAPTTYKLN